MNVRLILSGCQILDQCMTIYDQIYDIRPCYMFCEQLPWWNSWSYDWLYVRPHLQTFVYSTQNMHHVNHLMLLAQYNFKNQKVQII